jgi:hypothetical protein
LYFPSPGIVLRDCVRYTVRATVVATWGKNLQLKRDTHLPLFRG